MTITKGLLEAMLKVQSTLTNPIKSATNPHFKSKYATLPDIRDMLTPLLAQEGLFVTQPVQIGDIGVVLQTSVYHPESEGVMSSFMPLMLEKQTPQGMGSAITYARRYALCSILNIAADEDDDGNSASQKQEPKKGIPTRMADDPDIQEDMKALGYDAKKVYDAVIDDLNKCENSEMLSLFVKMNKTSGRMKGMPSDMKDDITTRYNTLKQHFADKGV